MKKILLLIVICIQTLSAQDFSESWEGYFSFSEIIDITQSSDFIYAAGINSVAKYDPLSKDIEIISTINGLIGNNISQIYYSEAKSKLVIGYENGILQVLDDTGEITTVVAIDEKLTIAPDRKSINSFKEIGDLLYIATDFGIALYDLERLEFNDTYFIGVGGSQIRITGIELFDGDLYAASLDSGILKADISDPFLIDFSNWNTVIGSQWDGIKSFDNSLFSPNISSRIWELEGNSFQSTAVSFSNRILDIQSNEESLVVVTNNNIRFLDNTLSTSLNIEEVEGTIYFFTSAQLFNDDLYVGTRQNGLLRINTQNLTDFEIIEIDGPSRNSVFSVTSGESGVWVGYGDYNIFYNPFPLESFGISRLREDEPWDNYSFSDINSPRSVSSLLINPDNPEQVFINSMIDGIVEFEPDVNVLTYDGSNSSLSGVSVASNNFRIPNATVDPDGDFWFLDSISSIPLHRLTSSGQWTGYDFDDEFPDIFANSSLTKIVSDGSGRLYFGTTGQGLFAFDPVTNESGRLIQGGNQGDLINNYISSLRVDQNNTLWIGSNLGLRVLSNPASMLDENVRDARAIVIEDRNGIARELLADQAVIDIEVDGNNNKWIATSESGAFFLSPTGRETLLQFTTENSPLPSNAINDISIDSNTGKVYFATDNGLVSYQGARSSDPQEDLSNVYAFPNPVRPGYEGNVTIDGLTDRARVKITDIEGNLVYEAISQGGSIPWDTRSFSGDKVASGVYFLLVNTDDVIETTVFKLMIIR